MGKIMASYVISLSLVLAGVDCVAPTAFGAITGAESDRFLVEVITQSGDAGGTDLELAIRDKRTGAESKAGLHSAVQKLTELFFVSEVKLIIHGPFYIHDAITVFDVAEGRVLDEIIGNKASFSPDRHLIVFDLPFPRHGENDTRNSSLILYDFSKNPQENTPAKEPELFLNYLRMRGRPLYPREAREKGIYYVQPKGEDEQGIIWPPVVWNDKGDMLAFVVRRGGESFLVVVDIGADIDEVSVMEKRIETRLFLKDVFLDPSTPVSMAISVDQLKFVDSDTGVEVMLRRKVYETEVMFKEPSFVVHFREGEEGGAKVPAQQD